MKNIFLAAVLCLGLPATSFAQDILSVIGPNGEVEKTYSMKQPDALDQTTYLTTTALEKLRRSDAVCSTRET